jgi:phosphoserine phosphatase
MDAYLVLTYADTEKFDATLIAKIEYYLTENQCKTYPFFWVEEQKCLEMSINCPNSFNDSHLFSMQKELLSLINEQNAKIDIALLPSLHREKKLFIADMDSTMIEVECIDELAGFAGLKDKVSIITEKAMRGELDFENALIERVKLLVGLPLEVLEECYNTKITYTKGGFEFIQNFKENGGYTALVSGGFTFFTEKVAAKLGFDENRANVLLHDGHFLTGEVQKPILGREAKLQSLIELREDRDYFKYETIAIGDGANDLAMIEEAGLGIAFKAKPKVAEIARVQINHTDLETIKYLV